MTLAMDERDDPRLVNDQAKTRPIDATKRLCVVTFGMVSWSIWVVFVSPVRMLVFVSFLRVWVLVP